MKGMKTKSLLLTVIAVLIFVGFFINNKKQSSTSKVDPNYRVELITPPGNKTMASKLISMRNSGFEPATLTVQRGTNVIFRNDEIVDRWPAADDHSNHLSYPGFDPKQPIKSSEVWEFTFNELGTWEFHDHLNPGYKGTIVVVEIMEEVDIHSF